MGKLRDFFAEAGLCDSTNDLARRPDIIRQIIASSRACSGTTANTPAQKYEERLYGALDKASAASLDKLIQQNIHVYLDQRLDKLDRWFLEPKILSVFYNRDGQKLLGLYDNGKGPDESGFLDTRADSYSTQSIDSLLKRVGTGGQTLLGTTQTHYDPVLKMPKNRFEWLPTDKFIFRGLLEKNPGILNPPGQSGSFKPATPQPF